MIGGISRRNWALRLSLVLNVCVFLYVCAHFGSSSGPWIEESATNWGANQVQAESVFGSGAATFRRINGTKIASSSSSSSSSVASDSSSSSSSSSPISAKLSEAKIVENKAAHSEEVPSFKDPKISSSGKKNGTLKEGNDEKVGEPVKDPQNKTARVIVRSPLKLQDAIPCHEKSVEPRKGQRGDFWVLYNYVPMSVHVRCWESITYTTHADYTFLDNLEPLLDRWRAPISIALHAPGNDFPPTLDAIKYARNCGSPLIAQLVTFHIYFSSKHVPKSIPTSDKVIAERYNCSLPPPWVNVSMSKMYKNERKILYPVNLGRNIARESAPTLYVLASDIELYPSPNLPAKFLEMIRRKDQPVLFKPNPKVFVLSIFEVAEKIQPPLNKTRLMQMLKAGTAIPFHKKLCAGCHNVPRSKEWQEAPETEGLHVFHIGKRIGAFIHWEPIFIGTNADPLYDERLSWEGKSDKMTQGYALCVLDYDFLILDNAFLVHRPGIKVYKKDAHRDMLTAKTNVLIKKIIVPELKVLYGTRKGCAV